jgi:hypothetical protein
MRLTPAWHTFQTCEAPAKLQNNFKTLGKRQNIFPLEMFFNIPLSSISVKAAMMTVLLHSVHSWGWCNCNSNYASECETP